jgi:hypothetical protein
MSIALETVQLWANLLKRDITSYRREIEYTGYYYALPILLDKAREYAQQQEIPKMELCLRDVKRYAKIIKEDYSEEIK